MVSLQDLRRPLRNPAKRNALKGVRRRRGALHALNPLMAHGDEKTKILAKALIEGVRRRRGALHALNPLMAHGDEKTKILAKALIGRLIHDTMHTRLHDPAHGTLPRFEGRLRRAVGSFKDHIR